MDWPKGWVVADRWMAVAALAVGLGVAGAAGAAEADKAGGGDFLSDVADFFSENYHKAPPEPTPPSGDPLGALVGGIATVFSGPASPAPAPAPAPEPAAVIATPAPPAPDADVPAPVAAPVPVAAPAPVAAKAPVVAAKVAVPPPPKPAPAPRPVVVTAAPAPAPAPVEPQPVTTAVAVSPRNPDCPQGANTRVAVTATVEQARRIAACGQQAAP
jgi:translation initiation factor IF-2